MPFIPPSPTHLLSLDLTSHLLKLINRGAVTSWAGQVLLSDLCHVSVLGSGEKTVLCFPVASIRLTMVPHPCGCAKRAMEANLQLLVAMTVILLSNQKCLKQKRSRAVPTSLLGKVL